MIVKEGFTKMAYFMTLRVGVVLLERNYISDLEQMLHFIKKFFSTPDYKAYNLIYDEQRMDDPKVSG